ncbi:MAG: hypothetical protein HY364_01610 [Candidatus Aenigmarchaeota archaeon]|nr:hypothetical protein [Candidatus Aenigmarchaeota archaeon]
MTIQEAIIDRRRKVLSLYMNRFTVTEIARILGWNRDTITGDLNWIRREHENVDLKGENPITDFLLRNADQYKRAVKEYRHADKSMERLHAIRIMKELDRERIETIKSIGIELKVPQTLETLRKESLAEIIPKLMADIQKEEEEWQRKRQSVLEGKRFSPCR